jgi:hypothetical protein
VKLKLKKNGGRDYRLQYAQGGAIKVAEALLINYIFTVLQGASGAMGTIIASLFREHTDFDEFRARVTDLRGEFPFGKDDMILIGEAYFERYPDCFSNRSCTDVALGYRMVRVCVIEKLVAAIPPRYAQDVRALFNSVAVIGQSVERMALSAGPQELQAMIGAMEPIMESIQATIDSLPTGMIKERFIGGVSYIHNVLYLINAALKSVGQ